MIETWENQGVRYSTRIVYNRTKYEEKTTSV